MTKFFKGLRDDGKWERFVASSLEESSPEYSGYSKVEEISEVEYETNPEIKR